MDNENNPDIMPGDSRTEYAPPKGYALSGKIMLSAIVILFGVVIFMVALHLYARWYLLRARRRNLRRGPRRAHLVFYVDSANPSAATVPRGLDPTLLNSLPIFVYSSKTHPEPPECAVCLSEFEENEKGRTLPKCNHSFHTECIDMWFHSHSTCPICRSPVERVPVSQEMLEIVVSRDEPVESQPGSSSNMCQACRHDEGPSASTSSFGARRSDLRGVSIDVPKRNQSFGRSDEEIGTESSASQAFKSPGSRLLSFKRMLSRGLPSSPGNAPSRGTEPDIGRVDTRQSQVQTPKATESVMQ